MVAIFIVGLVVATSDCSNNLFAVVDFVTAVVAVVAVVAIVVVVVAVVVVVVAIVVVVTVSAAVVAVVRCCHRIAIDHSASGRGKQQ